MFVHQYCVMYDDQVFILGLATYMINETAATCLA